MDRIDSLALLKKIIQEDVFITHENESNTSLNGTHDAWLFDFRRVLLQPEFLKALSNIFIERFQKTLPFQIGGLEVAGIPLLTGLVLSLYEKQIHINGFFIRKSRKKTGLLRMIEGSPNNEKVILIDDLLNTGSSLIRQVEIMESLGIKVYAIFVILRFRDLEYYEYFHKRGIRIESIFSLNDFTHTLGIRNEVNLMRYSTPTPFKREWYFKSEGANLFHVVPKSRPALNDENIFFGSDSGVFWALSQKDGSIAWKFRVGLNAQGMHIFSSPIIYDGLIFFGAYDGNVYALDTITGKKIWIFLEADWIESSPDISKKHELLYIGLKFGLYKKEGGIVALDTKTGKKVWEHRVTGKVTSSPSFSEKYDMVVCGSEDYNLYAFHAKTGALIWKFLTQEKITSKPGFDEKLGRIVFSSHDGFIYIVQVHNGELIHRIETEGWPSADILIHCNIAYVSTLAKVLYAVDLNTGTIVWKYRARARIFAAPVVIDNKIYFGSNDARLYELDLKTGKETGFFQATERITNAITYNTESRTIFLPTFANEIYSLKRVSE